MKCSLTPLAMMIACGSAASVAVAQPFVINISGATLMENYIKSSASTNDYLDCDGDGQSGSDGTGVEQLAPSGVFTNPYPANAYWVVQYRATGSVRGLQELIDFGFPNYDTTIDGTGGTPNPGGTPTTWDGFGPHSLNAVPGYAQRVLFITNGVQNNAIFNRGNPGAFPVRSTTDGTHTATTYVLPPNSATGGLQVDLAAIDVPVSWGVFNDDAVSTDPFGQPTEPGYGFNETVTRNKDGTVNGLTHKLANIGTRNTNVLAPDADTIFDTFFAYAPVAYVVNLGVGRSTATYTELRHLFATGRLPSGENLNCATRDVGSGTHNAAMNSICLDPSWGIGDNVGGLSSLSNNNLLGPSYISGNKNGSGGVEATARNNRLSIGYTGAERGVSNSWLTGGQLEVLGVKSDDVGANFARPTLNNILFNSANTHYRIGGPGVYAHLGDPRAEAIADGGDNNGNPQMSNFHAACYMNNLTRSIEAFTALPGGDPETVFSPGEFVTTILILPAAPELLPALNEGCIYVENPAPEPAETALRDYYVNSSGSVLKNPAYATFGSVTLNGQVPTRQTGVTYVDGVNGTQNFYTTFGSGNLTYATALNNRNRIQGDFSGNAVRNWDDIPEMIEAYNWVYNGGVYTPANGSGPIAGASGNDIAVHLIGDFDGDGNFTAADVRWFADGLALNPVGGALNRKDGYTRVDNAFGGSFFGVINLANGTYTNGDARADVSGPLQRNASGWAPVGHDGNIDGWDIEFVMDMYANNPRVTDGALNWSNLSESVNGDLSADMTGDLIVDQADLSEIVETILETTLCDVNLDGAVNCADLDVIESNFGSGANLLWTDGDINGDDVVDANDVAQWLACVCPGDANGDGEVDFADLNVILSAWESTGPAGDLDCSGNVDFADLNIVLSNWQVSCN